MLLSIRRSHAICWWRDETQDGAEYLKKGFEESALRVDVAKPTRRRAASRARGGYDLIVMDRHAPRPTMGGWESKLRAKCATPRAIPHGAEMMWTTASKGLELGAADDYLIQAVAFVELLARVSTLLHGGRTGKVEL